MKRITIIVLLVAGYLFVLAQVLCGQEKVLQEEEQDFQLSSDVIIPNVVGQKSKDDLPTIRKRGVLTCLVSFSRTDFFLQGPHPRGLMVEVLNQYEAFLNKGRKRNTPEIVIKYVPVTFNHLIPNLIAGYGDIAAGHLTVTPERERLLHCEPHR